MGVRRGWAFGLGVFLAAVGILLSGTFAHADFTDGMVAYTKISPQAGIRIWRRAAWQDDSFLSAIKLGDIYGDERGDNKYYDPVESYVWYYIASVSSRIDENISDGYARRIIADDFNRALNQQQKFMLLMTAAQREDARNRIIYILSCRGADGFIRLGQIHSTGATFGGGPRGDGVYDGLGGVWQSKRAFRDRAYGPYNRGDAANARRMMGISNNSVIVPNDGEALMYFHIAANMGHPLANEYLRGLDPVVRNSRWLGPRISVEANDKARWWSPPYEYYPLGDNDSGVPYTDECYIDLNRQHALALVSTALPAGATAQALWFLGWSTIPNARVVARPGPIDLRAVQRFQAAVGHDPSGHLTNGEAVLAVEMAAQKGDAVSQNTLGVMYAKGVGVPTNYVRASYWFQKAADQRYAAAIYHLGVLYKAGPPGIKQDLARADNLFTASALAGYRPTMNQLRELLATADAGPHREGHH
ncbi:MAG TPA: tetratricopeptide repeat protein [Rhizomicrobium sp.]|nr:tetratricopeptide repeat protein [Rhizomicrobium sp.]